MFRKDSPVTTLLILLNVVVYVMWIFVNPELMAAHFTVSWSALEEGRVWVLLTSVFSHYLLFHIFLNMLVLNSFGPVIEKVLGSRFFISFYINGVLR